MKNNIIITFAVFLALSMNSAAFAQQSYKQEKSSQGNYKKFMSVKDAYKQTAEESQAKKSAEQPSATTQATNTTVLPDEEYKPVVSSFSSGETLQFRNLQSGDSVAIYNMSGTQVASITGEPFAWDGKDQNGNYVSTDGYQYTINTGGREILGFVSFENNSSSAFTPDDYRPQQTVFSAGQTITFPNLQPGNSVFIFDPMSGEEVAFITDSPFTWNGKNDMGQYVASGPYMYQIEVNGMIVDGVIEFRR